MIGAESLLAVLIGSLLAAVAAAATVVSQRGSLSQSSTGCR